MGAVRLEVDSDACQGHALCSMYAPRLFDHDAQGQALVVSPVTDSDLPDAEMAVEGCPEDAIRFRVQEAD